MNAHYLDELIVGVYLVQIIELVFFPLPSEVTIHRLLRKYLTLETHSNKGWLIPSGRISLAFLYMTGTGITVLTFCTPLIIVLFPGIYEYLLPVQQLQSPFIVSVGIVFIVFGTVFTFGGVIQLSRLKTDRLKQSGLFGLTRNPINLGLMVIIAGMALCYPAWIMCCGAVIAILNLHNRTLMEEEVLAEKFDAAYRQYQAGTARYIPNLCHLFSPGDPSD